MPLPVGATGLAVFVVLVSALFAWMELNPGRFLHLLKVGGDDAGENDPVGKKGKMRRKGACPPSGDDGRGPGPAD